MTCEGQCCTKPYPTPPLEAPSVPEWGSVKLMSPS